MRTAIAPKVRFEMESGKSTCYGMMPGFRIVTEYDNGVLACTCGRCAQPGADSPCPEIEAVRAYKEVHNAKH